MLAQRHSTGGTCKACGKTGADAAVDAFQLLHDQFTTGPRGKPYASTSSLRNWHGEQFGGGLNSLLPVHGSSIIFMQRIHCSCEILIVGTADALIVQVTNVMYKLNRRPSCRALRLLHLYLNAIILALGLERSSCR